jgi:cytochrome c oxidase cbb3-type subunit I
MARRKKLRPYDEPPRERRSLVPGGTDAAAIGFMAFGALWLAAATGIGLLRVGLQLVPFGADFELGVLDLVVSFDLASVESAFLNALVFGWLTNAGLAAIFFITPRLVGRPLALPAIAFLTVVVWNLMVVAPGIASVYLNIAQPGRLAEFLLPIDLAALGALGLANLVFWLTVLRPSPSIGYVSLWYFGVALLALPGIYLLGTVPGALASWPLNIELGETFEMLINGAYVRALEAYWLLGAAVGTLYYVVPRATGNPLFSWGLALLGFALWAPLAGASAAAPLVAPEVPYVVTSIGIAATIMLVAHAFIVVGNLAMTMSGRWTLSLGRGTVPLAMVALAFLLATPVLEAIGALREIHVAFGLTDWSLGVFLFAALGTSTFAFFALADHAMPRMLRRAWTGGLVSRVQLWATFGGVAIAGLAFMAGGLAHGSLLAEGRTAEEISAAVMAYVATAGLGLALAALGGMAMVADLFLMYTSGRPLPHATAGQAQPAAAGH